MEEVDNPLKYSTVLGIFAKEPVPGRVKTRLTPPLSSGEAAELYRIALQETVANMVNGDFELTICYAGAEKYFQESFVDISLYEQVGDDLGARMSNALQQFFRQGYQRVVLIGSDSPDLSRDLIEQAFVALEQQALVLAPAQDGGYVLIGESVHHPQLFDDMPWSSADVRSITCRRADAAGINYCLLSDWDDLDDLEALHRFLQRSPDSETAKYLRSLAPLKDFSATG